MVVKITSTRTHGRTHHWIENGFERGLVRRQSYDRYRSHPYTSAWARASA